MRAKDGNEEVLLVVMKPESAVNEEGQSLNSAEVIFKSCHVSFINLALG